MRMGSIISLLLTRRHTERGEMSSISAKASTDIKSGRVDSDCIACLGSWC